MLSALLKAMFENILRGQKELANYKAVSIKYYKCVYVFFS